MSELYLIRHAQASFGTDDYDKLSNLGHEQSFALGKSLANLGIAPNVWIRGEMRRHRETLEGISRGIGEHNIETTVHSGLNEFDFSALLNARFKDKLPPDRMHTDRKIHFRTLRDTVLLWQEDKIDSPPESWTEFSARVSNAKEFIRSQKAETIVTVSSGGAISQLISATLQTPAKQQIMLQLQMKNCSVSKFIFNEKSFYLHGFNETPHITAATQRFLTYS